MYCVNWCFQHIHVLFSKCGMAFLFMLLTKDASYLCWKTNVRQVLDTIPLICFASFFIYCQLFLVKLIWYQILSLPVHLSTCIQVAHKKRNKVSH